MISGFSQFDQWVETVLTAVENLSSIQTEGPITATVSAAGILLKVPAFPVQIVKTTSTITARSGSTAGTGTVTFQMFNGTTFVNDAARTNVKVYNWSSGTPATPSGKYGVAIKLWGYWFLVSVEC